MSRRLIVEIIGDTSGLERSFGRASHSAKHFDRDLSHSVRGVAAGSGAFKSLGRSIAFASGGFIAFAGITDILRTSIEAGSQAAATQKQLAAQFRAAGGDLKLYQRQIDETSLRLSRLSGFQNDELTQSFTNAFRQTQNVERSLRIEAIAADVARGRHIGLAQATLALTKAYAGQTAGLRRLGVIVPTNLKGMQALEFVARRFAGQAEAGTTAQQRFAAALHNTAETIGLALLPEFTKLLNKATKWLDNEKNQARLQKDVTQAMHSIGTAAKVVSFSFGLASKSVQGYILAFEKLKGLSHDSGFTQGLKNVAGQFTFGFGRGGQTGLTGPAGTRAKPIPQLVGLLPGLTGPLGAPAVTRAQASGLHAQFQRSQLDLAKAQVTADQADDRRILAQQAKIIQAAISQTTNLKKRTKLYQQLGQIEDQIRSIDKTAADKRTAAQQKILDARKKALEKEKAQARKELAAIRAREQTLKDQIKAIQGRFKDAISTARQGIGDLFAGPVLNPSDDARRRTLGLGSPLSSDPRKLTADLRAQTAQFSAFQKDINTLIKRGAPNELIRELRAQGLSAAPEVRALATAGKGTLSQFFKAFGTREQLAIRTAKTVMRSQLVTLNADRVKLGDLKQQDIIIHHTVELDGQKIASNTTKHQARAQRRTAAQRTGRVAGMGPVVG